jgi:hypothetical protein
LCDVLWTDLANLMNNEQVARIRQDAPPFVLLPMTRPANDVADDVVAAVACVVEE